MRDDKSRLWVGSHIRLLDHDEARRVESCDEFRLGDNVHRLWGPTDQAHCSYDHLSRYPGVAQTRGRGDEKDAWF